jgi:hypothetical protein
MALVTSQSITPKNGMSNPRTTRRGNSGLEDDLVPAPADQFGGRPRSQPRLRTTGRPGPVAAGSRGPRRGGLGGRSRVAFVGKGARDEQWDGAACRVTRALSRQNALHRMSNHSARGLALVRKVFIARSTWATRCIVR